MAWGYLRAWVGQSRVCQGPGGKLMLWPQVVCKKNERKPDYNWLQLKRAYCAPSPQVGIRCGLIQELLVSCGPSRLCSPQHWPGGLQDSCQQNQTHIL